MEMHQTDILVAGGGVAGLTAAATFAEAGFDVIVVNPVPPVTEAEAAGSDMRSTAFLRPSVDLFREIGLWDRLSNHAAALRVMRIADAGGPEAEIRETADFGADELGADVFGYNLPNWLLRREMMAHLADDPRATLRAPARVVGITTRLNGAIVRLSDGASVKARLVIAADGRDSFVRDAVGIGVRRWGYGQKALVFTVGHELPHENVSTEIHRSGGPFTLVPLPGERASAVVWMDAGPEAQSLFDMDTAKFESALNARACGVLGTLRLTSERRIWPIITQVADRLDGPRVALVAEAAHVIPPIGAQGLNMSLRDIRTLRDLCATARDRGEDYGGPQILSRYAQMRLGDIRTRVAGVDMLNRAAMAGWQPFRDVRRMGLRALHGITPIRQATMRLGLGVA